MFKNKYCFRFLEYMVIILAVSTCLAHADTKTTPAHAISQSSQSLLHSFTDTSTETSIKHGTLFLKANYLHHSGKHYKALRTYDTLFKLDAPDYANKDYFRLLLEMNQEAKIVAKIDELGHSFEDDLEVQLIYLQSLLNTNNEEKAQKLMKQLREKYPNNEKVILYSAAHHEKNNNLQKAIKDIDAYLTNNPSSKRHFLLYFLKAKLLLKITMQQQALTAINKSLKLHSSFNKAILFKALLLQKMNNIPGAIKSYKNYLQIAGDNPSVIKQLVQRYAFFSEPWWRIRARRPCFLI